MRYMLKKESRKGMILLVIVAFLALFTIMGITYLLYADSQLRYSIDEIKRLDKRNYRAFDISTDYLFNFFLERFIYDQPDRENDPYVPGGVNYTPQSVFSALRGHSLARNMYGWNDQSGLNDRPFSGTGKLANRQISIPGTTVNANENLLINHTFFKAFGQSQVIDPERGARSAPNTPSVYTSSWNAPYTYPDFNNIYLAWLKSDGSMVKPSFHSEAVFGKMDASSLATNPNWFNDQGRYMSLRPRPVDNLLPADYAAAAGNPAQLSQVINQRILEGNLFPYPGSDGMDVKNLEGYPGGNDSIWIDVGSPVFYNIDGRKFKIMIAPLVLDLDGRLNLNVVGNRMVAGQHGSNQGWGPWEINPQKINNLVNPPLRVNPTTNGSVFSVSDVYKVDFNGGSEVAGPSGGPIFPGQTKGGVNKNSFESFPSYPVGNFGNLMNLEIKGHSSQWGPFAIGAYAYSNSDLRSLLRWTGKGSSPTSSALASLAPTVFGTMDPYNPLYLKYRNLVTSKSSDFSKPAMVPYYADSSANKYQLANTEYYPRTQNSEKYMAGSALGATQDLSDFDFANPRSMSSLIEKIDLARVLPDYPAIDWAFSNAVGGNGGRFVNNPSTATMLANANSARQQFANDIFKALLQITGAKDMSAAAVGFQAAGSTDSDYEANRYLAQLAVNMVDYLDNDDVMTEFIWKRDPGNPTMMIAPDPTKHERVYGNENKKLLINEVYAEIINDPADPFTEKPANSGMKPASKDFQVHFWVELVNPLPVHSDPASKVNHAVLEQDPQGAAGDSSVYQLELRDESPTKDLFYADNPLGVTRVGGKSVVSNFQPVGGGAGLQMVEPVGSNYLGAENQTKGFVVVGSNTAFPNNSAMATDMPAPYSDINNIANIKKTELMYKVSNTANGYDKAGLVNTIQTKKPSLVLRRLANPYMPPQNDSSLGNYNPYISVDVMSDITVNDGVTNATDDVKAVPPTVENRSSVVRRQPHQDSDKKDVSGLTDPTGSAKALTKQPQHTFMRHNGAFSDVPAGGLQSDNILQLPFTPLVHLDRCAINPIELLEVAGCKPAELTRRFLNEYISAPGNRPATVFRTQNTNQVYGHKIPWFDDGNRLSRFFEIAAMKSRFAGISTGGKEFGKVNINAIWDKEVFRALADASNSINNFTENEVDAIYQAMLDSRSPGVLVPSTPTEPSQNKPGSNDKPFWGFGVGGSSGGDDLSSGSRGLENSILRLVNGGNAGVFDLPDDDSNTPPNKRTSYQKKELVSKIANNITTKSNIFAVWLTTGFFEVTDDSTMPPKLGAEVGIADGTNIRHRMFALIDRTEMVAFRTNLTDTNLQDVSGGTPLPLVPANISAGMTVAGWNKAGAMLNGQPWSYKENMVLTFEPNTTNEETIILKKNVSSGLLEARFSKNHSWGCSIVNRGNPGPWPFYNRGYDPVVILHNIID